MEMGRFVQEVHQQMDILRKDKVRVVTVGTQGTCQGQPARRAI